MGIDVWLTVAVLLVMLVVLVVDRFPPAGVVLGANVALLIGGVTDTDAAFSGFSNPAPITVAALFVLAAGAQRTGLLSVLVDRLLGRAGRPGVAHARLLLPSVGASAFLNNTPLVAMTIPDVVAWCRRNQRNASRYLLPLSYAAILGGTLTVIGTSTNLIVSGLLEDSGEAPLGLFEVAIIGGPVVIVGLVVLFGVSIPLLPMRATGPDDLLTATRNFRIEMRVTEGPLSGRSVETAGLRQLTGVFLVQLERGDGIVAPVGPDQLLVPGDVLTFVGEVDNVLDLDRMAGLEPVARRELDDVPAVGRGVYEVVIGRTSPVSGRTLKEADFRARYGAAVLAIHRAGHVLDGKLGDIRLRNGDTLLVVANDAFRRRYAKSQDFLVVAEIEAPAPTVSRHAPFVGIVTLGFVAVVATGVLSTVEGALVAAALMVAGRVMTFSEAKNAIDLDVVVLIAAAFGVGEAVRMSGLASDIAGGFVTGLEPFGTFGLILGIVVATSVLTELVTNNAAVVVVFPIALAVATDAGIDLTLIAIVVGLAASTSFLSPIGYQTNTMVYGPGGYQFVDYLRSGLPLSIAVQLTIATTATLLA
ncbi:MAG: SLC13 family permease [Actinomycetota bacterium]